MHTGKQADKRTQAGNRADGDGQTIEQETDNRAGGRKKSRRQTIKQNETNNRADTDRQTIEQEIDDSAEGSR